MLSQNTWTPSITKKAAHVIVRGLSSIPHFSSAEYLSPKRYSPLLGPSLWWPLLGLPNFTWLTVHVPGSSEITKT